MIKFRKMHGLGNDFVILDARKERALLNISSESTQKICDRNKGIGCDQLIVLENPKSDKADIFMRIYNPDGGEAGACGNATRCVADIIGKEQDKETLVVETISGLLGCIRNKDATVTVDMGTPILDWENIPLSQECDIDNLPLDCVDASAVGMGNPHCIIFVENADKADVKNCGSCLETHPLFPERTNVEFVSFSSRAHMRMRVWERGAGITLACGSGACAAAVAAMRRNLCARKITITLDGGTLDIEWRESDNHVLMTGGFTYVFDGVYRNDVKNAPYDTE
ncbi:MAG: diaminopimelate epimerase [Micavibrio sp.]|nr:diaminopimelate epimerase [Micavibrio sp.]|tara:strand:+ start:86074 stop:86919 length:846 start_codon:yes stop_codon:yes gene_type:complete